MLDELCEAVVEVCVNVYWKQWSLLNFGLNLHLHLNPHA